MNNVVVVNEFVDVGHLAQLDDVVQETAADTVHAVGYVVDEAHVVETGHVYPEDETSFGHFSYDDVHVAVVVAVRVGRRLRRRRQDGHTSRRCEAAAGSTSWRRDAGGGGGLVDLR